MRLLLLLFPLALCAQFRAEVIGTTATQAVLRVTGWTGVCTLDVREKNASGTQHPDWTAMADSAHPRTTVNTKNEKFLVIGQRTGNKALAAGWAYYWSISGCGGTANGVFMTKPAILGAISHKQPLGDPAAWNGLDYPVVDLTPAGRNKWYVHPTTGIRHRLISQPEDFSFMDHVNQTFVHPAGGSGWSNFSTIVNGSTSTAQTSGTNPAYLYANIIGAAGSTNVPWNVTSFTTENIGILLWAQCVTGSGADCDIELMLFDDPNVLPRAGSNIVTVRAGGTFVQQTGNHPTTGDFASTLSAAVAGGTTTYPGGTTGTNGFPRVGFQGWGTFPLTQESYVRNTTTTATVSGVNLTIAQATVANHFPRTIKPGQHIYVQGAGGNCIANGGTDICTVATAVDSGAITIVETGLTAGSTATRPLPWGVAIRKKTATGTVRIGALYRTSGHHEYSTGTVQARCHQAVKTRSDGVRGRLCLVPHSGSFNHLYFISEDGEKVHPIDGLQQFFGNLPAEDFHPTDPDSIFFWHSANGLYKMTYNGDAGVTNTVWEKDPGAGGARYAVKSSHDYPDGTWSDPYFTITQVVSSTSISDQIAAQYPSQVSSPYLAWTASSFIGISGDLAGFYRTPDGQDNGVCQVALFNINSGQLVDFLNSGDTPGTPMHFGECHSTQFNPSLANSVLFSYNMVGNKGTVPATPAGKILHGPHQLQIEAIKRGGVMNNNTCLEWPMGVAGPCAGLGGALPHYDKDCPTVAQIPQTWIDAGAQASNCVTMRISGSTAAKAICNEKGNATGTSDDFEIFGACEWNADPNFSGGPTLEPGMKFLDRRWSNFSGTGSTAGGDKENFRVLTITPTGDGTTLTIVAQRNASREHCCSVSNTSSPAAKPGACREADDDLYHLDNWIGWMSPGSYGSCNSIILYTTYPDPTTKVGRYYTEIPRELGAGHPSLGRTSPTAYRWLGGSGGTSLAHDVAAFADLNIQPPPAYKELSVSFQGIPSPIGSSYQQYLSQTQNDANDTTNKYFGGDTNHVNGGGGFEQNAFAGGIEDVRTTFIKVAGFTSLWRTTVAGGGGGGSGLSTLKLKPVVGWCGPKALTDISSPGLGNLIDVAAEYTYCVAYKDGQCRNGSTAGMAWVKCPMAYKHPVSTTADDLHTGMEFSGDPSLISLSANAGFARRQRDDIPDETGSQQMLLTDFFKPAGTQFAYWDVAASPNGNIVLGSSAGTFGLVRQVSWMAVVPKMPLSLPRWNGYKPVPVKIGPRPGMTHARIRFGYNQSFECNPHYKTACVTDTALSFYAFIQSDGTTADLSGLTPSVCGAGGCTPTMYVYEDELLWYQIEVSTNGGTTFTADPVQVIAP